MCCSCASATSSVKMKIWSCVQRFARKPPCSSARAPTPSAHFNSLIYKKEQATERSKAHSLSQSHGSHATTCQAAGVALPQTRFQLPTAAVVAVDCCCCCSTCCCFCCCCCSQKLSLSVAAVAKRWPMLHRRCHCSNRDTESLPKWTVMTQVACRRRSSGPRPILGRDPEPR